MYDAEEHGRVLGAEPDRPIGEEYEEIEFLESCFRKLPAKHAAACRAIYIDGKNQGEAADAVGCSKSRLSNLHREALGLINDSLAYHERAQSLDLKKPRKAGF
jgi:DNA-directed RNA polymerase specialized sigma24 family protein